MSVIPAAAIIVRKQKQWVAVFRAAAATSPERAKTLGELGIPTGSAARRLRGHDVLRETPAGALYLDEVAWDRLRARRKRVAMWVLGTACSVVALVLYARRWG